MSGGNRSHFRYSPAFSVLWNRILPLCRMTLTFLKRSEKQLKSMFKHLSMSSWSGFKSWIWSKPDFVIWNVFRKSWKRGKSVSGRELACCHSRRDIPVLWQYQGISQCRYCAYSTPTVEGRTSIITIYYFCGMRDGTQGLTHTGKVIYYYITLLYLSRPVITLTHDSE